MKLIALKELILVIKFDNGKYAAKRNLYGMNYKNRINNENLMNLSINKNKYNENRNIKTEFPQRINKSQNKKRAISAKRRKNK